MKLFDKLRYRGKQLIIALVAAVALVVGGTVAFAATSASASPQDTYTYPVDTTHVCTTTGTQTAPNGAVTTCVSNSSSSKSSQTASAINTIKAGSSTVLAYMSESGLSASTVKKYEKLGKCKWMTGGYNSGIGYRLVKGKMTKMSGTWIDHTKQYVCHTGKGPSGYQVKKCGNYYWPKGMSPSKSYMRFKSVKLVKTFAGLSLSGSVSASVTTHSTSSSESNAVCVGSKSSGSGSGEASATASATAGFSVKLTSTTSFSSVIKGAFKALSDKLKQTTAAHVEGSAYAKANAESTTESKSHAECTSTTTTTTSTPTPSTTPSQPTPTPTTPVVTPTPTPTPTPEKPSVTIGKINQVAWGQTSPNTTVSYNVPGNGNAKITLDADTGSFTDLSDGGTINGDGSVTFTVSGQGYVSFTYVASSDKDMENGGTATLTATIRTIDTGATATSTMSFPIKAKPTPPVNND